MEGFVHQGGRKGLEQEVELEVEWFSRGKGSSPLWVKVYGEQG